MKKLFLLALTCLLGCTENNPMANKYNSITETLLGGMLVTPATLGTTAVPPAQLTVLNAAFNPYPNVLGNGINFYYNITINLKI